MLVIFNETKQPLKAVTRKGGDIAISMSKEADNRKKSIAILFQPTNENEKNIFENLDSLVSMDSPKTLLCLDEKSNMGVSYDLKHFSQTIRTDFRSNHRDVLFLTFELEESVLSDIVPSRGLYIHNYFFYKGTMGVILSVNKGVEPTLKFLDEAKKMMKVYKFVRNEKGYSVIREYEEIEEEQLANIERYRIRRYIPLKINKFIFVQESNREALNKLNVVNEKSKVIVPFTNAESLLNKIDELKKQSVAVTTIFLPIDSYNDPKYSKVYREITKTLSNNFIVCNVLMNDGRVRRR